MPTMMMINGEVENPMTRRLRGRGEEMKEEE